MNSLTAREEQIINLIVDEGVCAKQIAQRLGIAAKTVHAFLERIREKLGATNSTQAALMWDRQRRGVAASPPPAQLTHPGPDSLLRDFNTCPACRGIGFVRKESA